MLTEKEKEKIAELKIKFNIVKESKDFNFVSSRRVEVSRVWANKLLKASFILNIITVIILTATIVITIKRKTPEFYASTPSGKLFHLTKLE